MAARQQHGFDYQNYVIDLLALIPDDSYIGKNDAYCIERGGVNYPVQIKFIKKNSSIELGDYRRNKARDREYALIVGFWKGLKGNISDEHILYPPMDWWRYLFLTDDLFDNDLYSFLGNISNDKSDDDRWKSGCKKFKKRWNDYWQQIRPEFEELYGYECPIRLIQPRFKRDHKKQKRIQCAIPYKLFYKFFVNGFFNK